MGSYDQGVRESYLISISGAEKETKKEVVFDGEGVRGRKAHVRQGTLMGRGWDRHLLGMDAPPHL